MIYSQVALILLGSFWAPWWWISVVGLAYGWRFHGHFSKEKIITSSFMSGFMVWSIFSYYYDAQSHGKVSEWLATMIHMPSPYLIYLIAGLLAGIVTALSSFVGMQIHK